MSSLPKFPKFERLDIKHSDIIRAIAKEFPSYSDFNFVSMFTWNNDNTISVSILNKNLVVQFSDYNNGEIFFSFLGQNKIPETIDSILRYCIEKKIEPELRLIGQSVIDALSKTNRRKYLIEEDRDNHDYILSTALLSNIENSHSRKRTKYRHFERNHGSRSEFRVLDLTSKSTIQEIENLLLEWKQTRSKKEEDVKREFSAIRRSLGHALALNLFGYGTYVDKKLVAFTLFEIVHNRTAMLHFGKSNINFSGLSEYHNRALASYLASLGIEFMNNEQDMGIEGLRHSKMSSKPVDFLKKYIIRPL